MKDVLQLTTEIVVASSTKKKLKKVERHSEDGLLVQISLLKLMMKPESLNEKTRSVVNISSEYTSLQELDQRQVWNF